MKKILFGFAGLLLIVSSCKKQSASSPTPPSFISYFKDTSTNKKTGLNASSSGDLQNVPFVEDIDSTLIPIFAKIASPSTWSINVPPAGDQGAFNSCVGWTLGYGMLGYQYKIIDNYTDYSGTDKIFSAAFIWNQLNGGMDQGISFCQALKLIKEQGCCKWSYMPPNTTSYSEQPSNSARTNASNFKLSEFMRFRTVDLEIIKHYLSKNYPIPIGVIIDEGFMGGKKSDSYELKQDGRLVWKQNSGQTKGNHAMLLCGYDDNINAFKVLNSYGYDWGNNGFIWIDYNFFKTAVMKNDLLGPEIYLGVARKYNTVNDIDGNVYRTLKIGNQEWMIDNLKTIRYRNGDFILTGLNDAQWGATTTGAFSVYNNDPANNVTYGKLYNWYAVNDLRRLAPTGWHVPSHAEWTTLSTFLGGDAVAGSALRETGTAHWMSPNTGATNSSGFTALPGGFRFNNGPFSNIGFDGLWWSSTELITGIAQSRSLNYDVAYLGQGGSDEKVGFSVRCVKD